MSFSNENSDAATLKELGRRIARHRLDRNLTQQALAQEAGVSLRTVHRIEHGHSTQLTNLIRVLRTLRLLENFQVLIPAPAPSPIQQVKLHGRQRKRASSGTGEPEQDKPWVWGDEN